MLPSYRNQSVDLYNNQLTVFYMRATLVFNGLSERRSVCSFDFEKNFSSDLLIILFHNETKTQVSNKVGLSRSFYFLILIFRLDICEAPAMTYKMCPQCDENLGCKYWDLKLSCNQAKVSKRDNNKINSLIIP